MNIYRMFIEYLFVKEFKKTVIDIKLYPFYFKILHVIVVYF